MKINDIKFLTTINIILVLYIVILMAGWHRTLNRLTIEVENTNHWRNQSTFWKHEANRISPNIYKNHHN